LEDCAMASIPQLVFTFFFGLAIFVDYLCCRFILLLWTCRVISKSTKESAAIVCTKYTWGAVIYFTCWIRTTNTTPHAWREFMKDMAEADRLAEAGGRRPVFLMSNHVSFLDSIVVSCFVPTRVVRRARYYMISKLLKVPLLGTIARASGHFPVHFKRAEEDGNFKLDQERMAGVETDVDAHVARGGVLSLFPEGQLNRSGDVNVLQAFRYGTFKRALACDAIVWNFVMFGNHTVWPVESALGGSPGWLGVALHRVTPAGSRAFVEALRAAEVATAADGNAPAPAAAPAEDHVVFAEAARGAMQLQLDDLRAAVEGRRAGRCCCGAPRTATVPIGPVCKAEAEPTAGVVAAAAAAVAEAPAETLASASAAAAVVAWPPPRTPASRAVEPEAAGVAEPAARVPPRISPRASPRPLGAVLGTRLDGPRQ